MKKAITAFFLLLCVLPALCACGAAKPEPETTTAPLSAAAQATAAAAPTTQPAAITTTEPTTTEPATEATTAAFSIDEVAMTATPNSSCFSKIGYSAAYKTLVLTFRGGGTYLYTDVPTSVWQAFQSADSLGRYFNANIKGHYPSEKV